MEIPKDKKNLAVLVLLGVIGFLVVYYLAIRPMLGQGKSEGSTAETGVVEELPDAAPIDIMGKGIDKKIDPVVTEEEEAITAVFQEQQSSMGEVEIPKEYDVPLTDNASDQERMVRIMELQERYRNNNENFAVDMARRQAESEKAALQKEANNYKELYEQSIADNNEMARRIADTEGVNNSMDDRQFLRVTAKRGEVVSSLGEADTPATAFYGGGRRSKDNSNNMRNALKATIQQTVTVKDGDILPLRLTEDAYAGTTVLKAGTVINGIVRLNGTRMEVQVSNIEYRGRIMEVSLSVYDVDAQKGIYVPEGDIAQAATKAASAVGDGVLQASTTASSGLSISESPKAAVAGVVARGAIAGIGSLLKGSERVPSVTIHSGYKIFLMNER